MAVVATIAGIGTLPDADLLSLLEAGMALAVAAIRLVVIAAVTPAALVTGLFVLALPEPEAVTISCLMFA